MPRLFVTTREGIVKAVEAASGGSVMEAIRGAGIDELLALCGGSLSCATCHIYVSPDVFSRLDPPTSFEAELLSFSDHGAETSRLSCQLPFTEALDGMHVKIAPED